MKPGSSWGTAGTPHKNGTVRIFNDLTRRGKGRTVSAPSKLVVPRVERGIYKWSFADVSFEVDAERGARIIAFRFGTENILSGPDVHALNFGSTFWTSPQADWHWPPVAELDSQPYLVRGDGADLWFESAPGPLGIAVAKQFRVHADDEAVDVEYVMENRSRAVRSVAPWEISRLPVGGLTFFPATTSAEARSQLKVTEATGAIWFDNEPPATEEAQKVFASGSEGWIAHVDIARRMLLMKTYPRLQPGQQAPGEAEIELYGNPAHTYIEVEQQGPFRPLPPGEKTSWTVTWRLRHLPPGIEPVVGNKDLLALARALKARDPASGDRTNGIS